MNRIKLFLVVVYATIIMSSCVQRDDKIPAENNPAIPVRVMTIDFCSQSRVVAYTGIAEASQSVPLSFLTSGTIEKVVVGEGENVRKGQLLASLNGANYQNAYQMAKAKEKQAEDAYERLSSVYKNGSLPEVKMVEIETSLEQAKSALEIAKKNLDDCHLYSPVDGMIGKKSVDPGMNILSGITAFTVVKIDKIYVKISVPENEISSVSKGETAVITVPALDNITFTGRIEQKGVIANPLSHTYEIKIGLSNPAQKLIPGMLCNVFISREKTGSIIAVPQQVIQKDATGRCFVYTVDTLRNIAVRKNIDTGRLLDNNLVEISSGLQTGDRVIVSGYHKINTNSPVEILQ